MIISICSVEKAVAVLRASLRASMAISSLILGYKASTSRVPMYLMRFAIPDFSQFCSSLMKSVESQTTSFFHNWFQKVVQKCTKSPTTPLRPARNGQFSGAPRCDNANASKIRAKGRRLSRSHMACTR